jgi:hypothetical protein
MTWLDLVRKYFPDATDEEADYILWGQTAFPFAGGKHIEMQIKKYRFYSGSYYDYGD